MGATTLGARRQIMAGLLSPILGKVVRPKTFTIPADLSDASRVLVVDSGDLTEILFFYPVLSRLKSRFPGMRISFLVREGHSELVRELSQVNEMISYEPAHISLASSTYFALAKRLRGKDFDMVMLLGRAFNLPRSLLALLSGAKIRMGFSQDFTYPYINCELRCNDRSRYEGSKPTAFLHALGIGEEEHPDRWSPPEQDLKWAKRMIHFRNPNGGKMVVAVDPGKGKGNHRLVEESLAFLATNLAARYPAKVLVLSNNLDAKGVERFRSMISRDLMDIEPKNVKEALALLSCSDLLLSGNTDFFHFAVGMGIPTVGFFTGHDTSNWLPKGTPWVQIIQGVKGQHLSLEEFFSKIDTLLHFTGKK